MKESRKEQLSEKIRRTQEQMAKLKKADMQLKKQLADEKQKDLKAWQASVLKGIGSVLEKKAGKEYWDRVTSDEVIKMISDGLTGTLRELGNIQAGWHHFIFPCNRLNYSYNVLYTVVIKEALL